jgi:hypothetical protein
LQYVTEHDLGDGGNRSVLEIEVEAVAARCALRTVVGNGRDFGTFVDGGGAGAAAAGARGRSANRLRLVRQQVYRTDLVRDVEVGAVDARAHRGEIAGRQQNQR